MGVNGIYGLSGSGLDVESMVKVGMMSKQNEYDKMQQTYTQNEWKKAAYLEIYDKIQTYNTSTLSTFKMSSSMNARNATSSNAAISVTATAAAPAMSHTITVNQTATNAYLVGTKTLSDDLYTQVGSTDATISFNLTDKMGTASSASFQGVDNAKLDSNFMTTALLDVLGAPLQNTTATSINKISFRGDEVRFSLEADYTVDSTTQEISTTVSKGIDENAISLSVNSKEVSITYGELATLFAEPGYEFDFNQFVSLLNQKMDGTGVTASYSSADNGSLTFTNNNAGGTVSVSLTNDQAVSKQMISQMYKAAVDSSADTDTFETESGGLGSSDSTATAWKIKNTDTTTLGTSKEFSFDVTSSTSYYDLANAINNEGTNIRATFDGTNNTFSIYNMNSGKDNIVGISKVTDTYTQNLLNAMGLVQSFGTSSSSNKLTFNDTTTSAVYAGKNASVVVDGVELDQASNKFTEKGVNYDITNVTQKTTATVGVTQDVDKIVDNVKSFVESYNTLLSDLYKVYNEQPNSSYKPLTDAQKNEMTEEQIEKWEKKAKSGMLYHDATIRNIIDNMRDALSQNVTSVESGYNNAYSIGISTTGIYGQIKLDEDKLRTALTADPDSAYNVFAKLDSTTKDASETYSKGDGIAQRLGDIMTSSVKRVTTIAGTSADNSDDSTLSTLLRNLQTRMSSFRTMMDAFETKLYKKYDAMESSLAMLGSQLNYVTSSFGG